MSIPTPPTFPPTSATMTKTIIRAIFPALILGLVGLILFVMFAVLFAALYTAAGATPSVFANQSFMSILGFFVGFGGWIGVKFEEAL